MVFANKEVTITGHKGGRRDVFYNVFPLKDATGAIIGGLCLYLDVTELRAKETALCRQNDDTVARAASHQRADEATRTMDRVLAGMGQLSGKAADLGRHMQTLSDQARGVGGILGVIPDIADQTSLLARNAAGETGRGFAVVADEVRKLAEKTMSSTKPVKQNVTAIRDSAQTNNQAMAAIQELAARTSGHIRSIAQAASAQRIAGDEASAAVADLTRVVEALVALFSSTGSTGDSGSLCG